MYRLGRISSRGNPILKTVGNRDEGGKRSFRSLQCPALEFPRQTPAGQAEMYGRTVDFDQRCASGGRPEYCRACDSSVQTKTNRERNSRRHFESTSYTHSYKLEAAEFVDESSRDY